MVEHYYTKKQTSAFRPVKVPIRASGIETEFYTSGGVFSPRKLDLGTKLLIDAATIEKGWKVLDLGCGYGVVGILLKKQHPSIDLVMSDVNPRAVKLAKMNAKLHRIDADILQSDSFDNKELDTMRFDTILLNPPQTAGKDVCFQMIEQSKAHLKKQGTLQIVARSQKGGKQLSKKMKDTFNNIEETAKGSGYRVYVSRKE
jgi:16S rRNA G1207 methylase RsmC